MTKILSALALLALLTACGGGDPEDQAIGDAVTETRTVQPVDGATAIGRKDPEGVTQ